MSSDPNTAVPSSETILANLDFELDRTRSKMSYLAELHALVGELLNRSPGYEWVAVDRETFNKLRRLHGGDAP